MCGSRRRSIATGYAWGTCQVLPLPVCVDSATLSEVSRRAARDKVISELKTAFSDAELSEIVAELRQYLANRQFEGSEDWTLSDEDWSKLEQAVAEIERGDGEVAEDAGEYVEELDPTPSA